ncbi:MAG: hypothetical protein U1D66_09765 [Erythrobacter sp.]|nr:hypothetical protein [Erythrobacter sp.]
MPSATRKEQDNASLLRTQQEFRHAADAIADAWENFAEVAAIAVIGSAARALWKEVPRFAPYRRRGIPLWHECKDLDLALWIHDLSRLGELRRAKVKALHAERQRRPDFGVADHQVDTFLFDPGTDAYLGRLCHFNQCPKSRPECAVAGCGKTAFNRVFPGFDLYPDALADVAAATLYSRAQGRLRSALDLPGPADDG